MKVDQMTPVLLPVYGKAAESLKRTLEKPSYTKPITDEEWEAFNDYIDWITEERKRENAKNNSK